ncbi:MAG TPA: ABC transporter permease [Vicinamibacterales bacterium]|jgi:putative ABC transport system permease protein
MAAWCWVVVSRVRALFGSKRLDEDFEHEVSSHLDMLVEEHRQRGLSTDEARRVAILRFGGPMQTLEQHRDDRGVPFVDTTLQDIRYAFRSMRRHPAFSLVAIATLAVGIGAGTAVFTFVRAVLLRPLPYSRPDELVRIFETNPLRNWTRNIVAPANWADWRERNQVFTDIAAYEQFRQVGSGANEVFLTGFGEPQGLKSIGVTGNFFSVLGASPLLGRTFSDDETYEGKARVVVLSYGLWQSAFGGNPATLGRTITLSGRVYDVVGIMPDTFFFPGRDVQLWMPVGYTPDFIAKSRRPHFLGAVARLKPAMSLERAKQDMDRIAKALASQYPDTNTQMGVRLERLHDSFANEPRTALLMLSGAVGLLFLIVCANIANLQLGRTVSRSRELAIRGALGAGRKRLLRQLLTESLVLSAIGGVLGVGLALATQSALTTYAASAVPLFAQVGIDRSVLLFALAISIAAPMLFGTVPALVSSQTGVVSQRMEAGSRETRRLRNVLVAAEIALSVILLVGAVLLIRSLSHLQDVDPGFDREHGVAFTLTLPSARYPDAAARLRGFSEIERRLREQPGVQFVGATGTLALRGTTWSGDATIEGRATTDFERELQHSSTTKDYFPAMGIRLLAGRLFEDTDTRDTPPVTIVNETLARAYFRNVPVEHVIGKRITFGRPTDNAPWNTIVGVVADERQSGLDKPVQPNAYSSIAQRQQNPLTFVMRSGAQPEAVMAAARRVVAEVDKDLALTNVTTLNDLVEGSMEGHRFRTTLLSGFAFVALMLAALGVYGVLAYFVSQRSRELGIRLALGASPMEVWRLVVGQGLKPVVAGGVVGIAGAVALAGLMRTLLFGVEAMDLTTYGVAVVALAIVAATACAIPATKAMRLDPLDVLRDE